MKKQFQRCLQLKKKFKNTRQHPFISDKLILKFTSLNEELTKHLSQSKDYHNKQILDDHILMEIEELFDSKVGNEFNSEELKTLYEEGEYRFNNSIPPGYKDSYKGVKLMSDVRKYGDFIIWKQIINQSKESKKDIIFVTSDRKEDWWLRFKGKTVSPRPELIKEFQTDAKQSFYMYKSDRFLEYAKDFLNEQIDETVIEEIRELRKSDEHQRLEIIRISHEQKEAVFTERLSLDNELTLINAKRENLRNKILTLLKDKNPSKSDDEELSNLRDEFIMLDLKQQRIYARRYELMDWMEKNDTILENKSTPNKV